MKKSVKTAVSRKEKDGAHDLLKDSPAPAKKRTARKSVKKSTTPEESAGSAVESLAAETTAPALETPAKKKTARKKTVRIATDENDGQTPKPEKTSTSRVKRASAKKKVSSDDVGARPVAKRSRKSASSKVAPAVVVAESEPGYREQLDDVLRRISETPLSEAERDRRAVAASSAATPERAHFSATLPKWEPGWLLVYGARQHNLKSIDVPFPLAALTVVTGVSGSGKSSLVEDVLCRTVSRSLQTSQCVPNGCDSLTGFGRLRRISRVDQAPIGQTPTSNPATYTGLFDMIRNLFAQTPEARLRGFTPRRFSFNVAGGRCEKCEGAGQIKVEMHFLADVWVTCDACGGQRYDAETLKVRYRGRSISDVLDMTCGEALAFFSDMPAMRGILQTLCDVGLDYIRLGQSSTTLSGGEAQRVKLAAELSRIDAGGALYVLDEPTTGLHFSDTKKLLDVLNRLVDLGNTVVVVEHNLDVIKCADWIVDVGPEAGFEGGRLVFAGTPEQLLEYVVKREESPDRETMLRSYTGEALFGAFRTGVFAERPTVNREEYLASLKAAVLPEENDAAKKSDDVVPTPWELDGRRWHLELRSSRYGAPCKWDSQILSAIVEKLDESPVFRETNWNARLLVETLAAQSDAWFMRAYTSDEWLLRLRFRVPANTFSRDSLTRRLALRPLNEVDEIPLYGANSRVRVETVGAWQEIELKVFSFDEIDRQEFWDFLDFAIEQFGARAAAGAAEGSERDLTPWRTQGRDWHLAPTGYYGDSAEPLWKREDLERMLNRVEEFNDDGTVVWTKKLTVDFMTKSGFCWAQVFTKNVESLCLRLNFPKGAAPARGFLELAPVMELDDSDEEIDSFYARYSGDAVPDDQSLRALLTAARGRLKKS